MTYGQDYGQPDRYPQPGYGRRQRPEDQPWQPQYAPRHGQRPPRGPEEAPWDQAPYPSSQGYPPQDRSPQDYPPQGYPPQDFGPRDFQPRGYPSQNYPPQAQWQPQPPPRDQGQFRPRQQHHRTRSRTPLYVGAAALIVVAGGGTAYALARHATSGPAPAPSGATAKPASLSQLQKIVLRPADLSPGWKGAPFKPDPNDAANNAALTKCVGARNTDSDKVAEAHSRNFALGNASISSSATSFRSSGDVDSDVTMLHSPKLSGCFVQMMKKQLAASLPAGATVESASLKITPGPAGGPANVVATGAGAIKVRVSGQQVPVYLTVAFIKGPLIEAEVDTQNVGKPVPASVLKPLVAAVAARAVKG